MYSKFLNPSTILSLRTHPKSSLSLTEESGILFPPHAAADASKLFRKFRNSSALSEVPRLFTVEVTQAEATNRYTATAGMGERRQLALISC